MGSGVSAAQITAQRLERLSCTAASPRTSRRAWASACLAAALILPGMQWANIQEHHYAESATEQHLQQLINDAICEGRWVDAIALLRPIVNDDPSNAQAVFLLGYALHTNGQIDEAIEYHKQATKFATLRAVATYNWACGLALQGKPDEALVALQDSIADGFLPDSDLTEDADLKSLFNQPSFAMLNASIILDKSSLAVLGQLSRSDDSHQNLWMLTAQNGSRQLKSTKHISPVVASTRSRASSSSRTQHLIHASGPGVIQAVKARRPYTQGRHNAPPTIDLQKEIGLPRNYNGKLYLQPGGDGNLLKLEGTMQIQGSAIVQTRLVFRSTPDGCIEKTIECSVDGTECSIQRTGLINPNAVLECITETM